MDTRFHVNCVRTSTLFLSVLTILLANCHSRRERRSNLSRRLARPAQLSDCTSGSAVVSNDPFTTLAGFLSVTEFATFLHDVDIKLQATLLQEPSGDGPKQASAALQLAIAWVSTKRV
jgi:hypothetical protein